MAKFGVHLASMALLSVMLAFSVHGVTAVLNKGATHDAAFTIGVAVAMVVIPLVLVGLLAGLYRLFVKKALPRFYMLLWLCWGASSVLSIMGRALSPAG